MKKNPTRRYPYASARLAEFEEGMKRPCFDSEFSRRRRISFGVLLGVLFALSVLYAVLRCRLSYVRLIEAFRDLGVSVAFYMTLFFSYEISPTVNDIPDIPVAQLLPPAFADFKERFALLGETMFRWQNFGAYAVKVAADLSDLGLQSEFRRDLRLLPRVVFLFRAGV